MTDPLAGFSLNELAFEVGRLSILSEFRSGFGSASAPLGGGAKVPSPSGAVSRVFASYAFGRFRLRASGQPSCGEYFGFLNPQQLFQEIGCIVHDIMTKIGELSGKTKDQSAT